MTFRLATIAALAASACTVHAAPIDWNTWTSVTSGTIATAGGPLAVGFSGPAQQAVADYPSYAPASTFADGSVVANAPVAANGIMQLVGGSDALNAVTFAHAVTDPVMAIWSLGQAGGQASFVFVDATPVLVSGGPSAEYGGLSITVSGNTVFGSEANGTVRFLGSYTSLAWTNPQFEGWYGFNVGVPAVPEPASVALLLAGLAAVGAAGRRHRRRRSTA